MAKAVKKVRFTPVCVSIMVISLMVAGISSAVPFKNCVGMWLFDENKGDVVKDSSLKGNDGKITGEEKSWKFVEGKFGNAVEFDGVTASVSIKPDGDLDDVLNLNKDQTFSLWFKTNFDKNRRARILHIPFLRVVKGNNHNYRLWLWIRRSRHKHKGQLGFGYAGFKIPLEMNSGKPLNDDNWHHAVAILDHTAKQALLYIDGELSAQSDIAEIKFDPPQGEICIAGACDPRADPKLPIAGQGARDFFSGQIDDVGIFNVALKEGDIKNIMNRGLGEWASWRFLLGANSPQSGQPLKPNNITVVLLTHTAHFGSAWAQP